MSARPGRINTISSKRSLTRPIPSVFKTQAFVDKVDALWNLVRDEAIKAQEARSP